MSNLVEMKLQVVAFLKPVENRWRLLMVLISVHMIGVKLFAGEYTTRVDYMSLVFWSLYFIWAISLLIPPVGRFFSRVYQPVRKRLVPYKFWISSVVCLGAITFGMLLLLQIVIIFADYEYPAADTFGNMYFGAIILAFGTAGFYSSISEKFGIHLPLFRRGR